MKVYRIHVTGWTASFRYPNMISGYQPTLDVPPLSTIIGLISAAKGDNFTLTTEKIGYVFQYHSKNSDLETIYQKQGDNNRGIKSNVIRREFLYDIALFLYTDSKVIADYFVKPAFQLLLGRSGDLASVIGIKELEAEEKHELTKVTGTIIPFRKHNVAGTMQALPTSFSDEIPRRNIGTQPYYVIDHKSQVSIKALGFHDEIDHQNNWDVYWQEI